MRTKPTFSVRMRRRGVAGIIAGVILFAMVFTVGVSLFLFISSTGHSAQQANANSQAAANSAASEKLTLTAYLEGSGELYVTANNTGGVASKIMEVYISNEGGQLLTSYLSNQGPTGLTVQLPLVVQPGTSTHDMTVCGEGALGCDIGIEGYAYSYATTGPVLISVLTSYGNVFSVQYPPQVTTTTTTTTSNTVVGSTTTTTTLTTTVDSTTVISSTTTSISCEGPGGGACSTSTVVGQGSSALSVALEATPASGSENTVVYNGGGIVLVGTVTNVSPVTITGVTLTISPSAGVATGTASATASGCSPASYASLTSESSVEFTCDYTAYSGSLGGTLTFTGYASGSVSGSSTTSAEASSNTIQVGGGSLGPWSLNYFDYNLYSTTAPTGLSATYISDGNEYVAYQVQLTNDYSAPLVITDESFMENFRLGPDPTFFIIGDTAPTYPGCPGTGCPTSTPSFTAYDCPTGTQTGCITVPVGSSVDIYFAACAPTSGTASGSSTWVWQTSTSIGSHCTSSEGVTWCNEGCPEGDTVVVNVFYYYNGVLYSQSLPFESEIIHPSITPTITTTLYTSPTDAGDSVYDTATLSGEYGGATGTVTYYYYSGASCSGTATTVDQAAVSGGVVNESSIVTFSTSGSYSWKAVYSGDSNDNGATSSCESLTINADPTAGAITPSAPSIDTGQSITLTSNPSGGTGSYTYQWYTGASCTNPISGATSSTYSASPTSAATYYYKVTDGATPTAYSACSAGDTVTVNSAFTGSTVTISPASATLDSGQSVTLTVSWTSVGTSPYSVKLYSGTSATCTSDTTLVSTNTGITGTSTTFSPSPTSTLYYCATVSDGSAAGAESVSTTTPSDITVNPALAAGAITPSAPGIDTGQSITLTSHASGGTTPLTYQWYTGSACNTAISGATSTTYGASPTSTTTYSYKVTDSSPAGAESACSAGDTVTVNPTLAAGAITPSAPTVDSGQSVTLTSAPSGGTTAYTYQWYTGSSCNTAISGATSSTYSPSPTAATTYSYKVTDSSAGGAESACSAGDTVTVNSALGTPTVTLTYTTIDSGQSDSASVSWSGGTSTYTVKLYSSTTSSCSASSTLVSTASGLTASPHSFTGLTPTSTLYYCATLTDSSTSPPTTTSAAVKLTVNAAPTAGAISPAAPAIDSGQSIELTSDVSGGTAPLTYQWYTGTACNTAVSGATGATYTPTPTATTSYSYKATDSSPAGAVTTTCSAGDTVTVNTKLTGTVSFTFSKNVFTIKWDLTSYGTEPYTITLYTGSSSTCSADTTVAEQLTGVTNTDSSTTFDVTPPGGGAYYCVVLTDSAYSPESISSSSTATKETIAQPAPPLSAIVAASATLASSLYLVSGRRII